MFSLRQCVLKFSSCRQIQLTYSVSCAIRKLSSTSQFNSQNASQNNPQKISDESHFDVVVSGGGMVGAAMAAALGYNDMFADRKVLLLEGGPEKNYTVPDKYASRTCALSPSTKELLSSFGAWENIMNMRYREVKRMQVWEACSDAIITFNQEELIDNLAYIVENDVVLAAIIKQLDPIKDIVTVRHNARASSYTIPTRGDSSLATIHMADGETITTDLLIGADGFKSLVRETANIHCVKWDYKQRAVVATLTLSEEGENNVAWQRFLPNGPIALLPLSDRHSCLIWTTSPEDAGQLCRLPEAEFVDAVNKAFWSDEHKDPMASYASQTLDQLLSVVGLHGSGERQLPPTISSVDLQSRGMFPLGLCHASEYVKHRMALIGDAAHRCHPLAGQGVNLGFGDVTCLLDLLEQSLYDGNDLGYLDTLLQYETERQRHVIPTLATIDGLNRLYNTSFSPVVLLRTLGLQATNALGPIKDKLITHATT